MPERDSSSAASGEFPERAYDISPPPPPPRVEVEALGTTHQQTLSYDSQARRGQVIRGGIENRTEEVVPSSMLFLTAIQEENALTVTSLIGERHDYHLKPYRRSLGIELFSVAASPRAVVGRTYVLGFYLSDGRGGRSNLVEIKVEVVPRKGAGALPWLLAAAAVVAAVLLLTRKSRRSTEPREPRAAGEARVDDENL